SLPSASSKSEQIDHIERKRGLVARCPTADLENILVRFVVAVLETSNQRRKRLVLKGAGELPQGLRDRRSRSRRCSSEADVGSWLVLGRALARDHPASIFEDFSPQTDTPFLGDVLDQIGGHAVPTR